MPNIADISFEPRVTPEQIETLKGHYASLDRGKFGTSRTNFIVMFGNGTRTVYNNQPCHGSLGSLNQPDRLAIITELAYNRNQWNNEDYTVYAPFIDWFVNRSYMSRFILNREDISVGVDKGLMVSCDMSALLMQNIMITSRHVREVSPDCFRKFNELIAEGVDGSIAYAITMLTTFSTKDWSSAKNQPVTGYGGHRAASMYTIPALRRLLEGDYSDAVAHSLDERSRFFSENTNYYGGPLLFYTKGENGTRTRGINPYASLVDDLFRTSTGFVDALRAVRKAATSGEMYKPPNPFAPAALEAPRIGANQLTYEEFYPIAIPFILEALKK